MIKEKLKGLDKTYKDVFYSEKRWILVRQILTDIKFFNEFIKRTKTANSKYNIRFTLPPNDWWWKTLDLSFVDYWFYDEDKLYVILTIYDIGKSLCRKVIDEKWDTSKETINNLLDFDTKFKLYFGKDITTLLYDMVGCSAMCENIENKIEEIKKIKRNNDTFKKY